MDNNSNKNQMLEDISNDTNNEIIDYEIAAEDTNETISSEESDTSKQSIKDKLLNIAGTAKTTVVSSAGKLGNLVKEKLPKRKSSITNEATEEPSGEKTFTQEETQETITKSKQLINDSSANLEDLDLSLLRQSSTQNSNSPTTVDTDNLEDIPILDEAYITELQPEDNDGDTQETNKLRTSGVPFYQSITLRLLISFLVPIIGIIVLGLVSYQKASKAIVKEYTNSVGQTTDMLQQYITMVISTEIDNYNSYFVDKDIKAYFSGNLDELEEGQIRNTYNQKFVTSVNIDSKISGFYFLSNEGRTLRSDSTLKIPDNAYELYINTEQGKNVRENNNQWFVFGQDKEVDYALGLESTKYSIRLARNFQKQDMCMIIDIDEAFIRDIMKALDPGENGYVTLVTNDGVEFFSDENTSLPEKLIYSKPFYDKAMTNEDTIGNSMVSMHGEDNLFVYSKGSIGDYMITAVVPKENVISQASAIKKISVILMIISTIIALILGLGISRQMSKVINYILHQLRKVAGGDFTVRLKTDRQDEFGLLCQGINRTVKQMRQLIDEVNDVSIDLNSAASHVSETAATFMETCEDIQSAVSEIEVGVNRLDAGSADCLKQMDSLSGKILNVSTNTETIERLTEETGKTITEGIESVNGLMERTMSTTSITRNVITAIEELEVKSNSISEIVETINDISEETKLLSLNASIEAAHAGAAGKGFAVVADEIRKLSDQCMMAAGEISNLIEEIATQTGNVCTIAREAEAAVYSQTDVVENTTTSFRQIELQIDKLLDALQTIVSNVQTMDGSRNETLNSIEGISTVSAQTAANSTTVYTKAETQLSAIMELENASSQLQTKADHLIDVLNTFKL